MIRVVVSVGLLYLALRGINFAAIQSRLSQINLLWIGLAVAVTIFQIFLGALRWAALIIVASLPRSYGMIGDAGGRLALVFVDFAALAGGLGFLLLGHLPWGWLKSWSPTKHVHACSAIGNQVIFSKRSGLKIAALSLSIHGACGGDRLVLCAFDPGAGQPAAACLKRDHEKKCVLRGS